MMRNNALLVVAFTCVLVLATIPSCSGAKITLRYFNIRGLAESIRLTLSALGLEWDEVKYDRCDGKCPEGVVHWPDAKQEGIASGLLPFGQVPSLTYVDDNGQSTDLVQSLAIQRFLAERHGFNGPPGNRHTVDMVAGGVGDLQGKYSALVYNPKVKLDPGILRAYRKDYLPMWMPYFEKILGKSSSQWFTGATMTYADTMVWNIIDLNLRVDASCLDSTPRLKAFHQNFAAEPRIAAYLASPQRRPYANGRSAAYDTPDSPPTPDFGKTEL